METQWLRRHNPSYEVLGLRREPAISIENFPVSHKQNNVGSVPAKTLVQIHWQKPKQIEGDKYLVCSLILSIERFPIPNCYLS